MNKKCFILTVCTVIVMTLFTGCYSSTSVEIKTDGEGSYTTVNYLNEQMSEYISQMIDAINDNIPEGVNVVVSTKVVDEKPVIETSINYSSLEDFNEQLSKLNEVIEYEDNMTYEENASKIVNDKVKKAVNIYLEEDTFSYALKEYLKNNGIYIDDNSNMYRKFLKLIMSVVKIDEDVVEEFSNEITDEIIDEDNYIEDEFEYYDSDNWIDNDSDYEIDGPTIEKNGYAFFQEMDNEKILKLHTDSLYVVSEFIAYVVQMNMSDAISESLYNANEDINYERCMLYNKVFTEIGLAEKLKNALKSIGLEKKEYNMDCLKPYHVIDIFTDEYILTFNKKLNMYVCEDVEELIDSGFSLYDESGIEEDTYKIIFGKETLELNEYDLYEYCDEFGYLSLCENGMYNKKSDLYKKNEKNDKNDKNVKVKLDETPNTSDNIPIYKIIFVVFSTSVLTVYLYNKRKIVK